VALEGSLCPPADVFVIVEIAVWLHSKYPTNPAEIKFIVFSIKRKATARRRAWCALGFGVKPRNPRLRLCGRPTGKKGGVASQGRPDVRRRLDLQDRSCERAGNARKRSSGEVGCANCRHSVRTKALAAVVSWRLPVPASTAARQRWAARLRPAISGLPSGVAAQTMRQANRLLPALQRSALAP
jgi:hypothetical protein